MIRREPISGPSAWRPTDFETDDTWMLHLSEAKQAELLTATAQSQRRGLMPYTFGKADFPLPRLGPRIEAALGDLEDGRGFILLRGVPVDAIDDAALYTMYWGLGVHLGTPLTQNRHGERIVEIADRGVTYGKQVRGYMTDARLMPHCDASDLVALLCVRPAHRGGESCIASAMTIYNEILQQHPEYLDALCRGFRHNMRGEGLTGDPNEVTRNTIPVFSYYAGKLSCHFNRRLIVQGAEKLGTPLTPFEQAAVDYVNDLALRPDIRFDMDFRTGDVQLLNNHVIVHSRMGFQDHPAHKRRLLRLWTNVPNGRPLAPAYADRTNNGPRGGMPVATSSK